MHIVGAELKKDQIIDIGMDKVTQIIKFDVIEEELTKVISLNVLGIIYSVTVPAHECSDPKNIGDAWDQLLQSFGVCHLMGQKSNITHGSRELSDEEIALIESSPSNKK